MLKFFISRKILTDLSARKKTYVTATTGMARLQYKHGMTIHHWSGYGDGHLSPHRLVKMILTNPGYASTKQRILECEVLIIDEIELSSAKAFDGIELICRSVQNIEKAFGGIQLICAGSILQLPPVPSLLDPGLFAFQSKTFAVALPHKIHLNMVIRQDEPKLIEAINQLCLGKPTNETIQLIKSLNRPIDIDGSTVHMFGTNFDVEFCNYEKLQNLPGQMKIYYSEDKGNRKLIKLCKAPKALALKQDCSVIINQNLPNGLVNGLCGSVTTMTDSEVTVTINADPFLKHGMEGKSFILEEVNFTVCDVNGDKVAERKQFPVKLDYATTVDKAQGRTIPSLVIDCYKFWKPAQLGVAIG